MFVERVEVRIYPGFTENCYIVSPSQGAPSVVLVDPGAQPQLILRALGSRTVTSIILTHRHYDHTGAVHQLVQATGAQVIAHQLDGPAIEQNQTTGPMSAKAKTRPIKVDRLVAEGDTINVGAEELKVLHTPGHTQGCMCLYAPQDHLLLAGDTLFHEAVGRTDLPTGDAEEMRRSIARLLSLPEDTHVYPGHDRETTIGHERQINACI